MDPLSIIVGTGITASLVGLAFLSGHEYGKKAGMSPSATSPTSASTHCLSAKTAAHHAGGTANEHPTKRY
jgi:hypothetical protein